MSSADVLEFSERRTLCPTIVSDIITGQLWPTIAHLKELNQTPTLDKVKAHMYKNYRMYKNSNDCEKYVNNALKDQLLIATKSIGKSGEELVVFAAPDDCLKDGHDWYCFECHKPGSVAQCQRCWRVYHSYCIKQMIGERERHFVCSVCRELDKESEGMVGNRLVSTRELNQLLVYAHNRLIEKSSELIDYKTNSADDVKAKHLLFSETDLMQMLDKTKSNSYKKLIEFQMDCQNIVHCVSLLYGTDSSMANLAVQTLSDCQNEMNRMRECVDCYRMENQKQDKQWFLKPCNPPHDLIFAKQKGYPYWPSKVISRDEKKHLYNVRFFGSFHERALVDYKQTQPISTTLVQLRILKTSPPLLKALKELKQYQNNLQSLSGSNGQTVISPIRAVTAKRPRRRADGTRARKRSIKLEMKSQSNEDINESTNDSQTLVANNTVVSPVMAPNNAMALSPKRRRPLHSTSTPKPSVKSPIRTRNRGMKTPFKTKEIKTSPKKSQKSRRSLQSTKSSVEKKKETMTQYFNDESEIVSDSTNHLFDSELVTTKKSSNNKRNNRLMNGITNVFENDVSNSSHGSDDTNRSKRLRIDESEQTSSSLARSRPIRQSKPNSRYKSPEMEVKLPKRRLRNESVFVKKEPTNEVLMPSIEHKANPFEFIDESNSGNTSPPIRANKTTKLKKQTKGKQSIKPKKSVHSTASFPPPSSPAPQPVLVAASPPPPPVVSPKRGRPKGVKNKSTLEKKSPVPPKLQAFRVNEELNLNTTSNSSSGGCNCESKHNKAIKKLKDSLDAEYKTEIKQLKKNLEAVKQLNYRLQNENRELKSGSHDKQESNDLKEKYETIIKQNKKKQWCFNCEKEAIYFCCWNTSYCSTDCQQQHWVIGHKKSCRRVLKR